MLRALTLPIFLALTCLNPGQAGAHPHEFIDTAITLRTDEEGRLGAIGVVWVWDDLTSMLIIEDLGMDSDGNVLEPGLAPPGLRGSLVFMDAKTDDARLVQRVLMQAQALQFLVQQLAPGLHIAREIELVEPGPHLVARTCAGQIA